MGDTITYEIYMHTIKQTGKSYIGYTSKGMADRLHKHILNACYGLDTHFYRAVRKYGAENIKSRILDTTQNVDKAKDLEVVYIEKYDTYRNGYNQTKGGTGGITIDKNKDPEKYNQWISNKKTAQTAEKNPRYSGYNDNDIINEAVSFFKKTNTLTVNEWKRHCKGIGMPLAYSGMRFNGEGNAGFFKMLKSKLDELNIPYTSDSFTYKRTAMHNYKLGGSNRGKHWYNDGIKNFLLNPSNQLIIENNLKKGRIKSNVKN